MKGVSEFAAITKTWNLNFWSVDGSDEHLVGRQNLKAGKQI